MKTPALSLLLLVACGAEAAAPQDPLAPEPTSEVEVRPPCPLVCAGTEITPEGDHFRCVGTEDTCAAEPLCQSVWSLPDRLDCDLARTQDGSAFKGHTNNCLVIKGRTGSAALEAVPCVSGPAVPSCATCTDGSVTCTADDCWCTTATGAFGCVGA